MNPITDTIAEQSLRIVTALSAEVAVLRERLDIFEQVAIKRALIDKGELDRFRPDADTRALFKASRLDMIKRVFAAIKL